MCFLLWADSKELFPLFLDYIDCIDKTQKTKCTIKVADSGNHLEFLDVVHNKVS